MGKIPLFISNSEMHDGWRLIRKILIFSPIMVAVVFVNVMVDPAGLYKKIAGEYRARERDFAHRLARGQMIMVNQSMDDRLLEKYFIEELTRTPDIVVLGSSHSAWIGGNTFPGQRVINNSMRKASLYDFLALLEGYVKKNVYPSCVMFVVDPPLLSASGEYNEWESIQEDAYGMLSRLNVPATWLKKPLIPSVWFNMFSLSYFQKSLDQFKKECCLISSPADSNNQDYKIYYQDGRFDVRFLFDPQELQMPSEKRLLQVMNQDMTRPIAPDGELVDLLGRLINYLKEHRVRVVLCMLPVSPPLYAKVGDQSVKPGRLNIREMENFFRSLARKWEIGLIGSYDPAFSGVEGTDFYDGDHLRNEEIEKLFKKPGTKYSIVDAPNRSSNAKGL